MNKTKFNIIYIFTYLFNHATMYTKIYLYIY